MQSIQVKVQFKLTLLSIGNWLQEKSTSTAQVSDYYCPYSCKSRKISHLEGMDKIQCCVSLREAMAFR